MDTITTLAEALYSAGVAKGYGHDQGLTFAQVCATLKIAAAIEAQTEQLRNIEIALINYATQQRT